MATGFKAGDKVLGHGIDGVAEIAMVEKEHDASLGTDCDMGRYTIRTAGGRGIHNFPGYQLRLADSP